jgi:hypothetical protein
MAQSNFFVENLTIREQVTTKQSKIYYKKNKQKTINKALENFLKNDIQKIGQESFGAPFFFFLVLYI